MFKTVMTLMRGKTSEAEETFADAHAMTLLDQHIRDATVDLERARRALAIANAQDGAESGRIEALRARIADLEARAVAAIDANREDLAGEAAEVISGLENDLGAGVSARARFSRECGKLKSITGNAERRLAELERGRRTARTAEATRRLRSRGQTAMGGSGALGAAEATLKRLRERQIEDEAATQAIEAMEDVCGAELIVGKLRDAGFGEATGATAKSVLERLKRKHAGVQ